MEPGTQADGPEAATPGASVPTDGTSAGKPLARQSYTPLFRAQNEDRYRRQSLISEYEARYDCRLVVLIDQITQDSVTLLAECLHDVPGTCDLHLVLCSPGGDGEVAIRLARMAQAACNNFVVVVPEIARRSRATRTATTKQSQRC